MLITEDSCCYEGEFSAGPNLSGKVQIFFHFSLIVNITDRLGTSVDLNENMYEYI